MSARSFHLLIALLLGLCFSVSSSHVVASDVAKSGANPGEWTMDFDAAKQLAASRNLPILINFTGSDWCGWCQIMDTRVFADKEWSEYAKEKLVLVTIDFPNDTTIVPEHFVARNEELAKKFEIQGFPTYVLLKSDASTEVARLGAGRNKTAASFIGEVEAALAK